MNAVARFVQGLCPGYLGLTYDRGFVVTEETDMTENIEVSPWKERIPEAAGTEETHKAGETPAQSISAKPIILFCLRNICPESNGTVRNSDAWQALLLPAFLYSVHATRMMIIRLTGTKYMIMLRMALKWTLPHWQMTIYGTLFTMHMQIIPDGYRPTCMWLT